MSSGQLKKKLWIRADASSQIGTGHVMRCIAVGQAWQDAGGEVCFLCAEVPDALADRVKSEGFDVLRIDAEKGSPEDLHQTLEIISGFRFHLSSFLQNSSFSPSGIKSHPSSITIPWLVLDGYHFNLDYQRGIRAAGIKLLLIDDYNHLPEYEADILVNQNIGAEEIEYRCNPECRKLLGTKYVMLRREFRTLEPRERNFPTIGIHLLVTLGGADPDNVTLKVIETLQQLNNLDLNVKIIVGPANPHLGSLRKAIQHSTANIQLINSVRDMTELITWADVAVSAAGSTCWEFCRTGVPFLTLVVADNQQGVAAGLQAHNVAKNLGESGCVDPINIAESLTALMKKPAERERMSLAGMELVDGFGAERALRLPAEDCGVNLYKMKVILRHATMNDAELLFDWANDAKTRQNSFSEGSIKWDDHVSWLQKKLNSDDAVLFIAELEGQAVGQIRYDKQSDRDAIIDISVSPDFRGMGLASLLIHNTVARAAKELGVLRHLAIVHLSNEASAHAFRKAGFSFLERKKIKGFDCGVYFWEAA